LRWDRTSGPHRLRLDFWDGTGHQAHTGSGGIFKKIKGLPFRFIGLLFFSKVLGIRYIPPDPYLMDPDPTPFFSDFKDEKNTCFHIFFL
jgi:hypothetical protein